MKPDGWSSIANLSTAPYSLPSDRHMENTGQSDVPANWVVKRINFKLDFPLLGHGGDRCQQTALGNFVLLLKFEGGGQLHQRGRLPLNTRTNEGDEEEAEKPGDDQQEKTHAGQQHRLGSVLFSGKDKKGTFLNWPCNSCFLDRLWGLNADSLCTPPPLTVSTELIMWYIVCIHMYTYYNRIKTSTNLLMQI